jgi:hypothetical protein
LRKLRLLARACRNVFSSARTDEAQVIDAEARLAEAQGLAYGVRLEAKANHANAKHRNRMEFLERVEVFFSAVFQEFGEIRKKFSDWRIARIDSKIQLQNAKAAKWREIRKAVSQFFAVLRREIRNLGKWAKLATRRDSKFLKNLSAKVTTIVSVLLTLFFVVLLALGIIFNQEWLKALAPVGIAWSALGLRVVFKTSFYARLGQALVFIPTTAWIIIWLEMRFGR